MNRITIKEINVQNFKGVAKLDYKFNEDVTKICGQNGSGKSTIKNAWEWCLCQVVEDYIPMLNNKEIPDLKTSVDVYLQLDNGVEYKLTRESVPKTSPRGRENKLVYKIDDIEIQKNIYIQKISDILGAGTFENLPLLTDKDYFNTDTAKWKWTDRRKLLLKLSNAEEKCKKLLSNDKYITIKDYILKGFETSDIQSTIAKEKKELNKEQQDNITRIETKLDEMNELLSVDFDKIKQELSKVNSKITKLLHEPESDKTKEISDNIYKLTQEIDSLQAQDAIKLQKLKTQLTEKYNEAIDIYSKLQKNNIETIKCPNCGAEINPITGKNSEDLTELQELYAKKREEHSKIEAKIYNFEKNPKIDELQNKLSELKLELNKETKKNTTQARDLELQELQNKSLDLQMELSKLTTLENGKKHIQVWKDANREIADKLILVEEKELALQDYVKEQAKIISESVNKMFGDDISWSLFNENYNGSIEQDCICLYKGKRYSSLSSGEKNKVNIEITNTLQKLFDVCLPMFCDNSENMTLQVENIDSQLIWLIATKDEANIKAIKITDLY